MPTTHHRREPNAADGQTVLFPVTTRRAEIFYERDGAPLTDADFAELRRLAAALTAPRR